MTKKDDLYIIYSWKNHKHLTIFLTILSLDVMN